MARYHEIVNIHEAKTKPFPGWWLKPPKGEAFVIAKAGKPLVKVGERCACAQ